MLIKSDYDNFVVYVRPYYFFLKKHALYSYIEKRLLL